MTIALFIGRFQPFHNAHLQIIKDILTKNEEVIIGIGSTQESKTQLNPYSYEERKALIEEALKEADIRGYKIFPISDVNNDDVWVKHVETIVGKKYDIVYSGNEWVLRLFTRAGRTTKKIPLIPGVSATLIRESMTRRKRWEHLVPAVVARLLKKGKSAKNNKV